MRTCLFSALLFLVAASPATAADPYRTPIAAIIDTTGSHGDQALTSVALDSGIHLVTVTCYYWAASGSICAGGGDFDDGGTCDVGSDNGATIIRNSHSSHCWYRKNFGLNGVVDARQCGVHGDGVTDDYVPLNTCLGLAGSLGIPVVNTGGGVILDNTDDIVPPSNVTLTCGGNNQGSAADDDYRILNSMGHLQLTNAIVLDPTFIKSDHTGLRIGLSQFNSGLEGCNLEAGAGTPVSGVYPNPYSPSRWFPKCPPSE